MMEKVMSYHDLFLYFCYQVIFLFENEKLNIRKI